MTNESPLAQAAEAGQSQVEQEALLREIARLERLKERKSEVLVVDDMQTMRLLLAQALRGAGFMNIHRAPDGEAALKILEERPCDLALVDWNMPRMDGLQLLDRLRSDPEHNDIVFIMVTAETLDQRVIQAAEEKQDAYLTKPISPEKIDRRLELILEKRLVTAKALLAEAQGQVDGAVTELMAAAQNRPRVRWPLFALGSLLTRQGRWEEAERCYEQILHNDPEALLAKVELGRIREMQGEVDAARQVYHEAMTANPHFFRAYDALADSLESEGESVQALEILQGALRMQGTENAIRQERLGRLHYEAGQYPEAEAAYTKALELKPRSRVASNSLSLGRARLGQGLYEEAVEVLERAASHPAAELLEIADALLLTGAAHLHAGNYDKAAQVFARMQQGNTWPDGRLPLKANHIHREVGGVYLQAGQEEVARRHMAMSLVLDFNDQTNRDHLMAVCATRDMESLAEEVIAEAEAARDQTVDEIARRGLDLVAKGQYEAAKAEYRRGLEVDNRSGRLYFNLGKLRYRLKEEEGLKDMVSAARLGIHRQDWDLVVEVARFFAKIGHPDQGKALLKQVLEQKPEKASAQKLLADLRLAEVSPQESVPNPNPTKTAAT